MTLFPENVQEIHKPLNRNPKPFKPYKPQALQALQAL